MSTTVDNDTALTFLNVSNYITNQAGTADGNVAFPNSAVRTFNADADKDADVFKVEVLDINAAGDLDVELEVLKPKYDAAGKVTGHEQFRRRSGAAPAETEGVKTGFDQTISNLLFAVGRGSG
ncbi:MAG: hypothetical protein IPJ30_19740 [Acidobacteria bacterium]|nr:hypothetical protein [Acidobacteriota bacterium]